MTFMRKVIRTMRKLSYFWLLVLLISSSSWATSYSGYLNDPGNTALIGSDPWAGSPSVPPSPQFVDEDAIAKNVALFTFNLASAGTVSFESTGYAAGGISPYFTLFRGTGAGAIFAGSNYDDAVLGDGGDFLVTLSLADGDYTIALGAFENMSLAENYGPPGNLGDGFGGIGVPDLGTSYYELTADIGTGPSVPEPATVLLLGSALVALAARRKASRH
jgi:hypothetical protein